MKKRQKAEKISRVEKSLAKKHTFLRARHVTVKIRKVFLNLLQLISCGTDYDSQASINLVSVEFTSAFLSLKTSCLAFALPCVNSCLKAIV